MVLFNMTREQRKELEVLYAWSYYYKHYGMEKDYQNIQKEILTLQTKVGYKPKERTHQAR